MKEYVVPPIYGYSWTGERIEVVPDEAAAVKVVLVDMEGWDAHSAAKQLNFLGKRTRSGREFSSRDVERIRKNIGKYYGIGTYYGHEYPYIFSGMEV